MSNDGFHASACAIGSYSIYYVYARIKIVEVDEIEAFSLSVAGGDEVSFNVVNFYRSEALAFNQNAICSFSIRDVVVMSAWREIGYGAVVAWVLWLVVGF